MMQTKLENFKRIEKLGSTTSNIYKMQNIITSQFVVMKIFNKRDSIFSLKNEVDILDTLKDINVIKILKYIATSSRTYLMVKKNWNFLSDFLWKKQFKYLYLQKKIF